MQGGDDKQGEMELIIGNQNRSLMFLSFATITIPTLEM